VRERTFIVGFDPTSAPQSFFDTSGELAGFDIDLARAVADYFGWSLELLPIRWADREFELASGNIDTLWGGVSLTEQIHDRLYYTPPYMENRLVFMTMSDSGIRNLRGLRNMNLALLSASAAEQALAENEGFRNTLGEVRLEEHLYEVLAELEAGEVDAILLDEVAAVYYIRTRDRAAFGGRIS
jgi:polar amino acid transport system substrate-binding protein